MPIIRAVVGRERHFGGLRRSRYYGFCVPMIVTPTSENFAAILESVYNIPNRPYNVSRLPFFEILSSLRKI